MSKRRKILTVECPDCKTRHSRVILPADTSSVASQVLQTLAACPKCNTTPKKATRKKIVCPKCGDVYYGSHKLFSIETDMQGWVDLGYVKELCISCKSRQSYLEAEKRLEAKLLVTDPKMVMSQYKTESGIWKGW
jgi:hypothetical protein